MTENQQPGTTCSGCGGEVENEAAFCPHCGGLFNDTLSCCNHPSEEADGVCVIRSRTSGPLLTRPLSARQSGPDLVLVPFGEVIDAEKFLAGLQPGQEVDGSIT